MNSKKIKGGIAYQLIRKLNNRRKSGVNYNSKLDESIYKAVMVLIPMLLILWALNLG